MARSKTLPESVRAKLALAERLAALRSELFGDRGGPEMARRLGIPVRTWYNYEGGVTVPAEVILKIIELTAVEAGWLLHGEEPKFRHRAHRPRRSALVSQLSRSAHCSGLPFKCSKRTNRRGSGATRQAPDMTSSKALCRAPIGTLTDPRSRSRVRPIGKFRRTR